MQTQKRRQIVAKIFLGVGLAFAIFFMFAVMWAMFGDQITGRAAHMREQSHYYQQCDEMVLRMDEMYKTNKRLPLDLEELAKSPQVSGTVLWPNEVLKTNFILKLSEAAQLLKAGQKDVPAVFLVPRAFGRDKYCMVGFLAPARVEQYGNWECAKLEKVGNYVGLTNLSLQLGTSDSQR